MNEIRTRILVGPDHQITGRVPAEVPPGEHEAIITVAVASPSTGPVPSPFNVDDLPTHDLGPWPEGLSLRRGDMCGDDGR
jgi:hypothetical protein